MKDSKRDTDTNTEIDPELSEMNEFEWITQDIPIIKVGVTRIFTS